MKKLLVVLGIFGFVLAACTPSEGNDANDYEGISGGPALIDPSELRIQVVTTFSILTDMVQTVGGDLVDIYTITPIGEDPHDHEVLP